MKVKKLLLAVALKLYFLNVQKKTLLRKSKKCIETYLKNM